MTPSPPLPLLHRLFIRDGKLHPAWRAALYLLVGFIGSIFVQVAVSLAYMALVMAGALFNGQDPVAVSEQLARQMAAGPTPTFLLLLVSVAGLAWVVLVTWAFRRWLDKAPLRDLGFAATRWGRESVGGLGLALGSMLVILGAHLAPGWAVINLSASGLAIVGTLSLTALVLLPAAAIEEIIFRGYLLQTLDGWLGWWVSVGLSSLLFGLAHFSNPDFGWLPFINITLAGVLFAMMYRVTGRLWLPIAYHFMWNYAQGPLFGFPVSGLGFDTILTTRVTGPALWTGGAFGPEGGLIVTLVLLVLTGALWFWDQRRSRQQTTDNR